MKTKREYKEVIIDSSGTVLVLVNHYYKKTSYPLSLSLNFFKFEDLSGKKNIFLDEDKVGLASLRVQSFLKTGTVCVQCGLKGLYFSKEKSKATDEDAYHLNLYGIRDDGKHILLTVDHILPSSKGGLNVIANAQTMCATCNHKKGDKM